MSTLTSRIIKSKMKFVEKSQAYLAEKMGHKQSYLSKRITGQMPFTKNDMVVLKNELLITSKDEFLQIFFPELEWEK